MGAQFPFFQQGRRHLQRVVHSDLRRNPLTGARLKAHGTRAPEGGLKTSCPQFRNPELIKATQQRKQQSRNGCSRSIHVSPSLPPAGSTEAAADPAASQRSARPVPCSAANFHLISRTIRAALLPSRASTCHIQLFLQLFSRVIASQQYRFLPNAQLRLIYRDCGGETFASGFPKKSSHLLVQTKQGKDHPQKKHF